MRSLSNHLAWICALALFAPIACDDEEDIIIRRDGGAGTTDASVLGGTGGGGGAAGTTPDASTTLTQAQAVGVVVEANAGEVQVGGLALSRAATASTRSFAMMMVEEHSAAQRRLLMASTAAGVQPAESPLKDQLGAMAQATLADLSQRTGAAFDTAYLQSQVVMHQMVLMLLDQNILPVVTNAQLRTELMAIRASVAMHLAHAQQLLGTGADGGAGAAGGAGGTGGSAGTGGAAGADAGADAT